MASDAEREKPLRLPPADALPPDAHISDEFRLLIGLVADTFNWRDRAIGVTTEHGTTEVYFGDADDSPNPGIEVPTS